MNRSRPTDPEGTGRIVAIMQAVGFALWQLQELETTAAAFVTVRLRDTRGVGFEQGSQVAAKLESLPLGPLIRELVTGGATTDEIGAELSALLEERNWLVHRARRETRGVLGSSQLFEGTMARLELIAERALALTKQLGAAVEAYVIESGVSREFIDRESARLTRSWGVTD